MIKFLACIHLMDQSGFEPEFPPCEGGILAGLDDWPVRIYFSLYLKEY